MNSDNPVLPRLKSLVSQGKVREALMLLNSLTGHRFTALYRFDRETLRNLYFFDRENPSVDSSPDIPVLASYCVHVRDSGRTFETTNASQDPHVEGHPKRETVQSYCGVPLVDDAGKAFGSVCHFDLAPRAVTPESLEIMEAFAGLIRRAH